MVSPYIAVDPGSDSTLLYIRNKGIVLNEPSVVALSRRNKKNAAIGTEARELLNTDKNAALEIKPLGGGTICNFELAGLMLKKCIQKVRKKPFLTRLSAIMCIPGGISMVEQKAFAEILNIAGVRDPLLIDQPRAAAMGAGLDIFEPRGTMIVDIGGSTTEITVISLGEIVMHSRIKTAGASFDKAITGFFKKNHDLLIEERAAEQLKISAGVFPERIMTTEIEGRNLNDSVTVLLKTDSEMVSEALIPPVEDILAEIKGVLGSISPELSGDIYKSGIMLTGGGALLKGLNSYLSRKTEIPFYNAEDPVECAVKGAGKVLENMDKYSGLLISAKELAVS